MFAINAPLTQAPDVNQRYNYFEGQKTGFGQVTEGIKLLQNKRALNQQDVQLAQNQQKINQDAWRTQVQAQIQREQMDHDSNMQAQRLSFMAQDSQVKMADDNAKMQMLQEKQPLELQQLQLNIQKTSQEIESKKAGNTLDGRVTDSVTRLQSTTNATAASATKMAEAITEEQSARKRQVDPTEAYNKSLTMQTQGAPAFTRPEDEEPFPRYANSFAKGGFQAPSY